MNGDLMVAKNALGTKKTAQKFRGTIYKPKCLRESRTFCSSSIVVQRLAPEYLEPKEWLRPNLLVDLKPQRLSEDHTVLRLTLLPN
jgi:hypothetical protein